MSRQPVVDLLVRGVRAADVKHDVHDEKTEQYRESCDQDERGEHCREEDEYRMPLTYPRSDALDDAVTARLEHRHIPIASSMREGGIVSFERCGHARGLPGKREG
jgi:hypothetical protein